MNFSIRTLAQALDAGRGDEAQALRDELSALELRVALRLESLQGP